MAGNFAPDHVLNMIGSQEIMREAQLNGGDLIQPFQGLIGQNQFGSLQGILDLGHLTGRRRWESCGIPAP